MEKQLRQLKQKVEALEKELRDLRGKRGGGTGTGNSGGGGAGGGGTGSGGRPGDGRVGDDRGTGTADRPDTEEVKSFTLKYAKASAAVTTIEKLFGAGNDRVRVRVIADERTNQVFVQASSAACREVEAILRKLDVPND
jgi:type II secretory pathway component GspD/PulD (secretin)